MEYDLKFKKIIFIFTWYKSNLILNIYFLIQIKNGINSGGNKIYLLWHTHSVKFLFRQNTADEPSCLIIFNFIYCLGMKNVLNVLNVSIKCVDNLKGIWIKKIDVSKLKMNIYSNLLCDLLGESFDPAKISYN